MQFKAQYPLVSIALCTYNGERYLEEQLDSLINQSYPNLEIIAIDDCSSDKTLDILNIYASKSEKIKIFTNEINVGYVKNFEKAIRSCKGEFIALSDQDDVWDLNKIQLLVDAINDHILIYHDSELIAENGESFNINMSDTINLYQGNSPESFLIFNCVSGHSCLFKRELLEYVLPFKNEYYHDHWLAYVAANLGSIGFIDKNLVKYRQHSKNNTDVLKKKGKKKKKSEGNADINKFARELKWLKHCASFIRNKNPEFVNHLVQLHEKRMDSYFSIEYVIFLLKNRNKVLYIQKKSLISKHTYIYKQVIGLRAKLLLSKIFD